jgi:hypothetical protein
MTVAALPKSCAFMLIAIRLQLQMTVHRHLSPNLNGSHFSQVGRHENVFVLLLGGRIQNGGLCWLCIVLALKCVDVVILVQCMSVMKVSVHFILAVAALSTATFTVLFDTYMHVCVFSDNTTTFDLVRVRRLEGLTCPDFSAILPNGRAIIVISEKPFKFTYDSVRPVDNLVKKTAGDDEGMQFTEEFLNRNVKSVRLTAQ